MTDTQLLILAAVGALLVIAVVALAVRWSRRRGLRKRFGPEYEYEVERTGDQRLAEKELAQREKRHRKLKLREIPAERQRDYRVRWRRLQAHFVESPREALADAESLTVETMRERGFPVDDFDQRHDEISVEHPEVVADYRKASTIAERDAAGEATTEELREAMVCYRRLFEALVGSAEEDRPRTAPPREREQEGALH